jgi:GntR family transcriptional repressor for pyruvate dehydrogenase complex
MTPITGQHISRMPDVIKFEQKRASEIVAEQLRDMIMAGELRVGDRLPNVRVLAESFGVSKATMSEALRVLSAMGLIEARQGLGTFVGDRSAQMVVEAIDLYVALSAESIYQVYELRKIIEPALARLAAERITAEQLTEIEATLTEMQQFTEIDRRFMEADVEFHNSIFSVTGNEIATTITRAIHELTVDTWVGVGAPRVSPERICSAHARVVEALKARDPDAAEAAVRRHLDESVADLKQTPEDTRPTNGGS